MLKHTRIFLFSLIYIIIHLPVIVNCQESSFLFTYSTNQDEMAIAAIEADNGAFVISCQQGDWNSYNYHVLLLKLSESGDSICSRIIINPNGNCFINRLIRSSDSNYFGIGSYQQSQSEMSMWLIKFDENLNVLWEKMYKTNCITNGKVDGFITYSNELVLYGSGDQGTGNLEDIFIYKVNLLGDSLLFKNFPDPGVENAMTMGENIDSTGYIMTIMGNYQVDFPSTSNFIRFGNDIEVIRVDSLTGRLRFFDNSLFINNQLLITGLKVVYSMSSDPLHNIGVETLDTSYSIIHSNNFGSMCADTESYPAYYHNIDTVNCNRILLGGTFNHDNNSHFPQRISWFMLTQVDSTLTPLWIKFYGGDKYYKLWGLIATSDGGCLLLGSTYNFETQSNERDILIIKVDSLGVLTGVNSNPGIVNTNVLLYPNPGSKLITLRSAMLDYDFRMMDVNGKLVCSKKISAATEEIDTETLPSGIYLYTISKEQKIIETGKWVKK